MWWPLMQSLGEHLKADAALSAVTVRYGVKNPAGEVDTVDLRYGGTPGLNLSEGDRGTAALWVDVMKHLDPADAETDAETGQAYADLYALTNTVVDSLREWWTSTQAVSGASFSTEVQEIRSDGDELRDYGVTGARIILNINWITGG